MGSKWSCKTAVPPCPAGLFSSPSHLDQACWLPRTGGQHLHHDWWASFTRTTSSNGWVKIRDSSHRSASVSCVNMYTNTWTSIVCISCDALERSMINWLLPSVFRDQQWSYLHLNPVCRLCCYLNAEARFLTLPAERGLLSSSFLGCLWLRLMERIVGYILPSPRSSCSSFFP